MKQLGQWLKPQYILTAFTLILIIWIIKKLSPIKLEDFTQDQAIAEIQFQAMRDYGTDENIMFESLEGLSKQDLIKVYKAFGLRNYTSGGKGLKLLGFDIVGKSMDLFSWYANELSEKELSKMKVIWQKSGLKLPF